MEELGCLCIFFLKDSFPDLREIAINERFEIGTECSPSWLESIPECSKVGDLRHRTRSVCAGRSRKAARGSPPLCPAWVLFIERRVEVSSLCSAPGKTLPQLSGAVQQGPHSLPLLFGRGRGLLAMRCDCWISSAESTDQAAGQLRRRDGPSPCLQKSGVQPLVLLAATGVNPCLKDCRAAARVVGSTELGEQPDVTGGASLVPAGSVRALRALLCRPDLNGPGFCSPCRCSVDEIPRNTRAADKGMQGVRVCVCAHGQEPFLHRLSEVFHKREAGGTFALRLWDQPRHGAGAKGAICSSVLCHWRELRIPWSQKLTHFSKSA